MPDEQRRNTHTVVAEGIAIAAGKLQYTRFAPTGILIAQPGRPAIVEAVQRLGVKTPVDERLLGEVDDVLGVAVVEELVGLVPASHQLRLPDEKRPATEVVDWTPRDFEIRPIDLRIAISTGGVGTEEPREAENRGDVVGEIPRVGPAGYVEQVFERFDIAVRKWSPTDGALLKDLLMS